MKNLQKLALSLAALNVAIPYLKKALKMETSCFIYKMDPAKGEEDKNYYYRSELGFYILPGIVCPPYGEYNPFVQGISGRHMLGRCYFVDYGGEIYDPQAIAEAVAEDIRVHSFKEVRFLTISIGEQIMPFIREYLAKDNVKIRSWAIDPCIKPSTLYNHVRRPLQLGMPLARALKVALGWLGQQRIIPWDCETRSYAEIEEQAWEIAYGDYSSDAQVNTLIIDNNNEFMDPETIKNLYQGVNVTLLYGLKHCRFAEDWGAYLHALDDAGFYNP